MQKEADSQKGEQKRDRQELGQVFRLAYKTKVLKDFDFDSFIENLENIGANNVVLFCVEEKPKACHRSIVTEKLHSQFNYNIHHL